MITWRFVIIVILLTLSILDLSLTYYYVYKYKKWQPDKPYKLIEMNPLLVFLWNKFGLLIGMIIGSVLILALNYIVGKECHWAIIVILLFLMIFAMFNHSKNITLLHKLIEMYPSGYLPVETFGNVVGNKL